MCTRSFFIQADWQDSSDKFWIGVREESEAKTVYHDVEIPEGEDTACAGSLVVRRVTKGELEVTRESDKKFLARILAPRAQYKFSQKAVCASSIDVTDQGLGCSTAESDILLWETYTGTFLKTLKGHLIGVNSVRFFPSGLVLLSAGADMMVKIWSAETGECARTLTGHKQAVLCACPVAKDTTSCRVEETAPA